MNRDTRAFIDRIARVTSRNLGGGRTDPPVIPDDLVRQVDPGPDLVPTFIEHAQAVGMSAEAVPVVERIAWAIRSVGEGPVLVDATADDAPGIAGAIGQRARVVAGVVDDDALFGAAAAVVVAQAGVAETGSVVFTSVAHRPREITLVPPRLVVLLDENRIVADLVDLLTRSDGDMALLGNLSVVTGPSKTADIEGIPITGVHGPGDVRIGIIAQ